MKGSHAGYNAQNVTDDKHGLIVHTQATSSPTDHKQLSAQTELYTAKYRQNLPHHMRLSPDIQTQETIAKLDQKGIAVIVPNQQQASEKEPKPFNKKEFVYDEKQDKYTCPQGHQLRKTAYDKTGKQFIYRITSKKLCRACGHFGICAKYKKGRTIKRILDEETREKLAAQYEAKKSQLIYKRRKTRAEHPFGHIKRNLGMNQFLLRGTQGTNTEISIAAVCFNKSANDYITWRNGQFNYSYQRFELLICAGQFYLHTTLLEIRN